MLSVKMFSKFPCIRVTDRNLSYFLLRPNIGWENLKDSGESMVNSFNMINKLHVGKDLRCQILLFHRIPLRKLVIVSMAILTQDT